MGFAEFLLLDRSTGGEGVNGKLMCLNWVVLGLNGICLLLKLEGSLENHVKFVIIHVAGGHVIFMHVTSFTF